MAIHSEEEAEDAVALRGIRTNVFEAALDAARDVAALIDTAGVPCADAGGLAVFAHGWRSFRADPEIIVSSSCGRAALARALDAAAPVRVRGGFEVWSVGRGATTLAVLRSVQPAAWLDEAIGRATLDRELRLRVLAVEALTVVKLRQDRAKDRADLVELAKAGALPVRRVRACVARHAPDLVARLDQLVATASREKRSSKRTGLR